MIVAFIVTNVFLLGLNVYLYHSAGQTISLVAAVVNVAAIVGLVGAL